MTYEQILHRTLFEGVHHTSREEVAIIRNWCVKKSEEPNGLSVLEFYDANGMDDGVWMEQFFGWKNLKPEDIRILPYPDFSYHLRIEPEPIELKEREERKGVERITLVNSETGEERVINVDDRPKLLRALDVFGKAFMAQATEEGTIASSFVVGLAQGVKYKGSVKNGVIAGIVTDVAISTVNGIIRVVQNWKDI